MEIPSHQLRRISQQVGIGLDLTCIALMVLLGNLSSILLASAAFLGLVAAMRVISLRSNSPLLFLFFICSAVFIEIPCAFFGGASHLFPVDQGLAIELPPPTAAAVWAALTHLTLCYVAIVVACSMHHRSTAFRITPPRTAVALTLTALLFACSVVYDFHQQFGIDLNAPSVRRISEVLKFVSYDVSIAAFWIVIFATWRHGNSRSFRQRAWIATFAAGGFIGVYALTGSKGAILIGVLILVVVSGSFGLAIRPARLVVPRARLFVMAGLLSIPLFGLVQSMREERKYENSPQFTSDASGISDQLLSGELLQSVVSRVSAGYLRYVAIVSHFQDGNSGKDNRSAEYLIYSAKSFMNLLLPGTPFPKEYAPSSALLEPLLGNSEFKELDRDSYRTQLNSQPTTIFGFGFIVLGWATPVALAAIALLLDRLAANGLLGASTAIPLAYFGMQCYGLDAAMQVSLSFTATFMLLVIAGRGRVIPSFRCAQEPRRNLSTQQTALR